MAPKKILLIDDDPDIQAIVKAALEAEGRVFVTAGNGVEGVEKAFTEMPDIIVLDVMMPKMNGYQVCRLLKNEQSTWEIPIVMLTARAKDKDRYYGLSIGADAYLPKPFEMKALRTAVDELLAKSEPAGRAAPVDAITKASESNLLSRVNSLLDRKLQEMTFLQYMMKEVVSTFDEEKILRTVLRGIETEIGYKKVAMLLKDESGAMVERCASGSGNAERPLVRLGGIQCLKDMVDSKEPVVLKGAETIPLGRPGPMDKAPARQQCLMPVVFRDEVMGMVLLERQPDEPPFSEERLGLLGTLAGQLGLALDNASLYRSTLLLSITDGLTGLFNARYFYDQLEVEISRSKRYGHPLSLFMLDIDFFKNYNDTYGHLSGDEALRKLARLFKEICRETDTVSRYGGEEFSVILPETDPLNAEVLAERIRGAVEIMPMDPGGGRPSVTLTVSIGIATMPPDMSFAEELVRLADKALYRAKDDGRNKVRLSA